MGIFQQPTIHRDQRSRAIDPVVTRVAALLRTCLAPLDPRVLTIPEKRLGYAHFAYGAIIELAAEQGLDKTQCLAALAVCLQQTPGFSPQDVSYLVGRCMNSMEHPQNQQARQVGAQAVRDRELKHLTAAALARLFNEPV
ncbi:MAG: hypothetical protein ACFCVA_20165 [Gammaproteobacteria bacterium]